MQTEHIYVHLGLSTANTLGYVGMHLNAMYIYTQGCHLVYLRSKNPNFGTFFNALEWKVLVYFKTIWVFRPFFYEHVHIPVLVCFSKKNLAILYAYT
jgi:hypothetical protein